MGEKGAVEKTISGAAPPISYRKGGRIKRTGVVKVHAGEVVIPKKEIKRLERLIHGKTRKRSKRK